MKVAALDLSLERFSAPHRANYTEQMNQFQQTAISEEAGPGSQLGHLPRTGCVQSYTHRVGVVI